VLSPYGTRTVLPLSTSLNLTCFLSVGISIISCRPRLVIAKPQSYAFMTPSLPECMLQNSHSVPPPTCLRGLLPYPPFLMRWGVAFLCLFLISSSHVPPPNLNQDENTHQTPLFVTLRLIEFSFLSILRMDLTDLQSPWMPLSLFSFL